MQRGEQAWGIRTWKGVADAEPKEVTPQNRGDWRLLPHPNGAFSRQDVLASELQKKCAWMGTKRGRHKQNEHNTAIAKAEGAPDTEDSR